MLYQEIRQKLYDKYIAPLTRKKGNYIGVELELPIVNLQKEAVDFDLVFAVTERFMQHFHFEVTGRDEDGHVHACKNKETGDILSYDCAYSNLELSFGVETNIVVLDKRFHTYYTWLQKEFGEGNHMLTGMGINPYRRYNPGVPIETERYRMLMHHLESYTKYSDLPMYFHPYPRYGTFASASQVQLDVTVENVLQTLRVFSLLEPINALLFSNSVLLGEREELLCCRDMMWENSTHGINPHNIGMFEALPQTIDELLDYIASCSLYCVMREGKYINFRPTPLLEYMQKESVKGDVYVGDGKYETVTFTPELDDVQYLRSFKFEDLTYRGTIEYRSACCQPVYAAMVVAAYFTGLQQKLAQLDELLTNDTALYHHGYTAGELRKLFNAGQVPATMDVNAVYGVVERVVALAEEGLKERGLGEEMYLAPLFDRVKKRTNPAKTMLQRFASGESLEAVIKDYGRLAE